MNNFVFEYNEDRKTSGVGGALYFKKPTESKYAFAFATGTIPSVVGDVDTYDAFVMTERYKGKTQGQQNLDKIDLPVVWHRDMKARCIYLESLGELDFLIISPEYTAEQITGTLAYRRGDLGDSTFEGVVSITPATMNPDKILDARSMLMPTCKFQKNGVASIIPDSVKLAYGDSVESISIPLDTGVTAKTRILDGMGNVVEDANISANYATEKLTITGENSTGTQTEYYLVEIEISETGKQSWKSTISVEVPNTKQSATE